MNRVVMNSDSSARLVAARGPVELRDEAGRLRGHFVPRTSASLPACPYDEQQHAAMRSESGGRSLEAIWKSAGSK